MQQKVYIAMALAQDADTILMDEPTTYLDIAHQLRLMDMARQLANEGKAVVMVLHDLSQALRTADHVIVMHEGEVVCQGTSDEVYDSGCLQKAFDVEIERIQTKTGWHYICDSELYKR
jgi:iron complex transport system ATP-binding protein